MRDTPRYQRSWIVVLENRISDIGSGRESRKRVGKRGRGCLGIGSETGAEFSEGFKSSNNLFPSFSVLTSTIEREDAELQRCEFRAFSREYEEHERGTRVSISSRNGCAKRQRQSYREQS